MNTLLIATLLLFASTLKPSYTKDEIRAEYDKAQKQSRAATKGQVRVVNFRIDTAGPSILSQFFRENYMLASYLFTNHEQVA